MFFFFEQNSRAISPRDSLQKNVTFEPFSTISYIDDAENSHPTDAVGEAPNDLSSEEIL